jgi:hypothetical protein
MAASTDAGLSVQANDLVDAAHQSDSPRSELMRLQELILEREPLLLPKLFNAVCEFKFSQHETAREFTAVRA